MPRKKIQSDIPTYQRRWLSKEKAADIVGFSVEFFDENVAPYIKSIKWGDKRNSPISYDREDIDAFLEKMKRKPLKEYNNENED